MGSGHLSSDEAHTLDNWIGGVCGGDVVCGGVDAVAGLVVVIGDGARGDRGGCGDGEATAMKRSISVQGGMVRVKIGRYVELLKKEKRLAKVQGELRAMRAMARAMRE